MSLRPPVSILALLLAVMAGAASAAGPLLQPLDIIRREGRFVFEDGSSYYVLESGGRFSSGPIHLSGRTIEGTWKSDGSLFIIQGRWGWINGLSPTNDRRQMKIAISGVSAAPSGETTPPAPRALGGLAGPMRIYKCYFIIDELVRLGGKER